MASIRASGALPWCKDRYKTVRRVAVPQNVMDGNSLRLNVLIRLYCCTATRHMLWIIVFVPWLRTACADACHGLSSHRPYGPFLATTVHKLSALGVLQHPLTLLQQSTNYLLSGVLQHPRLSGEGDIQLSRPIIGILSQHLIFGYIHRSFRLGPVLCRLIG